MMQTAPTNLVHILEHAARFHGEVEVVTRLVEDGAIHRYTYADAYRRSQQFANALQKLGVKFGDCVATLGWNSYRHLETWYALVGQGAICHTVNPRLFQQQIEFILNHAEDQVIIVDAPLLSLVESMIDSLPHVRQIVVMTDAEHMPETPLENVSCYETLLSEQEDEFKWPSFPDDTPSGLCYTSGTTGDPKGVLYTHRSNLLHANAVNAKGVLGISMEDSVLMIVPMFHANSWGLAYACPMAGSKLVLPGSRLDGESIYELLTEEQVTFSAAVPTVWNMLLSALAETDRKLPDLKEITAGGSATPRRIIETFDKDFGVTVVQGWGMTELSPMGTTCRLKAQMKALSYEEQVAIRLKQGPPIFGVSMKIVDDAGEELPRDGREIGRLLVKGPWIVQRYFRDEHDCVDADGWFDTGDVGTIDELGYLQITDRAKDLIKSGGEWISSVDLENAALGHAEVELAAVIGIYHEKWEERPLLIVVRTEGSGVTSESIVDYLRDKVAKWWLPDAVEFVDEIPLTAAGKISKLTLRKRFVDYKLK